MNQKLAFLSLLSLFFFLAVSAGPPTEVAPSQAPPAAAPPEGATGAISQNKNMGRLTCGTPWIRPRQGRRKAKGAKPKPSAKGWPRVGDVEAAKKKLDDVKIKCDTGHRRTCKTLASSKTAVIEICPRSRLWGSSYGTKGAKNCGPTKQLIDTIINRCKRERDGMLRVSGYLESIEGTIRIRRAWGW